MLKMSLLGACVIATRLPTTPADCAGFGNSHSDDALKSTGQVQAQDALRILDPSVTVGH